LAVTLLLIDKPFGQTSFQVVAAIRRETGERKVGHAGTLDPRATGLLLVAVGRDSTKGLAGLVGLDKEYEAEILLGEKRSTGDLEGIIIAEKKYQNNLSESDIRAGLSQMTGKLVLPISAYSAVKKAGVPFYKKARQAALRGEMVPDSQLSRREMIIHEAELLGIETESDRLSLKVRFSVGSGTYIRSLAEELGRRLGYPATLKSLRRTRIGTYDVKSARSV
jgi:tRNA pseudouridine55 synthase